MWGNSEHAVPEGSQEPLQQKDLTAESVPSIQQLQQAAYGKRQKLAIWKHGVTQARGCDDKVIIITAYSPFFSQMELFMEFKLKSKINCESHGVIQPRNG